MIFIKSISQWLGRLSLGFLSASLSIANGLSEEREPDLVWSDVKELGVEGRAFADAERSRWFDRFPASAEGVVTEKVWSLSRQSAGMRVRFKTDSEAIWADYTLMESHSGSSNQTGIARSGLDLYARTVEGEWRWVGVSSPKSQTVRAPIVEGLAPGFREYMLYLPLRNAPGELRIGTLKGARLEKAPPSGEKPIVFYGTSINHGASASRSGMVHIAILGRRLDHPVMNFGFAGNGRMHAEVGEFLGEIDAAMYVIDCLPNMREALVRENCIPFLRILRKARPNTPIVLVEDRTYANSWILPGRMQAQVSRRAALRECLDQLRQEGMEHLYFIPGDTLLGTDDEATTDGSHPSDLGFMRQANAFEPVLRGILQSD